MKNVLKIALLLAFVLQLTACKQEDDAVIPVRDPAVQYTTDINDIQTFLKTHKLPAEALNPTTMEHLPFTDAVNVVPELDPSSIWGSDPNTPNSNLLQWHVEKDGVDYIIYYLQLQQGNAATSKSPCNLDSVLAAYEGQLLDGTVFDSDFNPQSYFNLNAVIRGWAEIFPKFKTGTYASGPDGIINYSNFGAGIMFIPSGLAYFALPTTSGIPAYAPLIFSFKLYELQRNDNDNDGIFSYQEDINGDGYIRDNETTYEDDTDQDGTPDAFDLDDDGDGFSTRDERKYFISTTAYFYPFDGVLVNDPATPQDETEGIPSCSGDKITPTRLRKHRDPSCH